MHQDVKALKSELALLKQQFSERVNAVEAQLNALLERENGPLDEQHLAIAEIDDTPPVQVTSQTPMKAPTTGALSFIAENERKNAYTPVHPSTPAKPSFVAIFMQSLLASLFDWFSPVTRIFHSYKERGMLGIFALTMVGIALTLAGFGYLMQLLIDQLGAGSKSLLMCLAALLVMGGGIYLKSKTRFAEFATAIVTLGILLSYSTVYFSGSVYGIIPNFAVLFLYLLIALLCHVLALLLDTKIVAGLGIIGIATMPILSNTLQIEPFYYLLSLLFVTSSSLILAYRISSQWLANISLAFCIVALEWAVGIETIAISAWLVDVFYLLFFAYIVINLYKNKRPDQQVLIMLAALVGATVLLFFQASNLFSTQMSISFALNAMIAAAVSMLFYKIRHNLTHFLVLLSASWTVLAVVSAMSSAYWGIAWAIEGLLLLYIGREFAMTRVTNQAQALMTLALVYCGTALGMYFPLPALQTTDGWLLSIVILVVLGTWQRLINVSDVFDHLTQHKIKPLLQFIEVVWLSILLIATLHIWLGNWTGVFVILLQLAWLFRARQCQLVFIEIFAATLILVPLYYSYQGVLMVDSYRFSTLPTFAQCSFISAFLQLCLWSAFYRKFQPNSALKHMAEATRIAFYLLLPICWVGTVIRRFDENALMLLWLSPLLALFFAKKIKHPLLVKETQLLTLLASGVFILFAGQLKLIYGLIALTGFVLFYGAGYYVHRSPAKSETDQQPKLQSSLGRFICSWAVITLGFAVPSMIGFHRESLLLGLIASTLWWVTYLIMLDSSEHLSRNESFITAVLGVFIVAGWGLTFTSSWYVILPILFLVGVMSSKQTFFAQTRLGHSLGQNSDLFLHSILAITYATFFASLMEYRLDLLIAPALAVHGAVILFMKDRRLVTVKYSFALILLGIIKLGLNDASNALLWQKVILFMGIGVFILVASFWYQKLVSDVNKEQIDN